MNRHEVAELKNARMHPSGKYDFEADKKGCDGEGYTLDENGEPVTCFEKGCH